MLTFERGLPISWDATIGHTSAPTYTYFSSINAGSAAALAETVKEKKYAQLADRVQFFPVGLETLGAFGPSALQLVDAVASRIRARTGEQGARTRLCRRLAAAIQMGNAACIVEAHTPPALSRAAPETDYLINYILFLHSYVFIHNFHILF